MKIRSGLFVTIALVISFSEIFLFGLNFLGKKADLQRSLELEGLQAKKTLKVSLASELDGMEKIATFVSEIPSVRVFMTLAARVSADDTDYEAELAEYRRSLHQRLAPSWDKMTAEYNVRQMHFHLGPGATSFLRVHKPEKFGDNLDALRHMIVDVNSDGKKRQGLELGRVYTGLRGAVPIFSFDDAEQQVGALEVGTSFEHLIGSLNSIVARNMAVLIQAESVNKAAWDNAGTPFLESCQCVVEASSGSLEVVQEIMDALASQRGNARTGDSRASTSTTIVKIAEGPVVVTEFAIEDYIGIRDGHVIPVGKILMWRSADRDLNLLHRQTLISLGYVFISFVVIMLLVWLAIRAVVDRLEAAIDVRTMEIRKLNVELEEIAHKDVLTGVYSRRYLMERVEQEINKAERESQQLSLIMLDVDYFKCINDDFGHQAGDDVLSKLGLIMLENVRSYDVIGRYGGEEFCILIPGVGKDVAYQIGEKLRKVVQGAIKTPGSDGSAVTISVGIAEHMPCETMDNWFGRVDAALYEAKRKGRNQVIIA